MQWRPVEIIMMNMLMSFVSVCDHRHQPTPLSSLFMLAKSGTDHHYFESSGKDVHGGVHLVIIHDRIWNLRPTIKEAFPVSVTMVSVIIITITASSVPATWTKMIKITFLSSLSARPAYMAYLGRLLCNIFHLLARFILKFRTCCMIFNILLLSVGWFFVTL